MRTVTVLACALLLLAGIVSAADSQATARAIEDRWKNCSQIVQGRLGALYPDGNSVYNAMDAMKYTDTNNTVTATITPCTLHSGGYYANINFWRTTGGSGVNFINFDRIYTASGALVTGETLDRVISFSMPAKVGEVATIQTSYSSTLGGHKLTLTSKCNASAVTASISSFSYTLAAGMYTVAMDVQTIEACARFPFTNKGVPAGGVAAIIIVILCFALEFGACFKYHKDHKDNRPIDEAESMQAQ